MSLTNAVSSSDASLKLSKKIVETLSEKFGFKFDDGWTVISSRTYEQAQKRVRREKKRGSPSADVKHPRTAYSFFTSVQRPLEQKAHPEATFGQLSGYVSNVWKTLTTTQQQTYKEQEAVDKARYKTESEAAKAAKAVASTDATATVPAVDVVVPEVKAPKSAKPKATASTPKATASASAPVAQSDTVVSEVKSAKVKSAKAKASVESVPAVVPAVSVVVPAVSVVVPVVPVVEVKSATKVKKDEKVEKVEQAKAPAKKSDKK